MISQSHRNALPEGYQLLWYKIKKVLGEGGFGITYLAEDTNLGRFVAIKEYLPSDLAVRETDSSLHPISEDRNEMYSWGLDRFNSEARTLAKFNHPNVVRVYNVFEENNTAYMVMEFEHGHSLDQMIKTGKLNDEAAILNLLYPLLDALENVHRAKIIHRDIKPANIYIRENGTPVLLDFGSARIAMGTHTRTLTSVVSPGFAPFEQYNPEGSKQGPWTDIYAMAATLYAIVVGKGPLDAIIRGNARLEGSKDLLQPAIEIGRGRYSEQFLHAIDRALEFLPADRPQSIKEWRTLFPKSGYKPAPTTTAVQQEIPTEIRPEKKSHKPPVRQTSPQPAGSEIRIKRSWLYGAGLLVLTTSLIMSYPQWAPWLKELALDGSRKEQQALQEQQARLDKEKQALEAARRKEIEEQKAKNKAQFENLMKEARQAMDRGDNVLALKMLKLASSLDPEDMVAKLNLQRVQEIINKETSRKEQISNLLSAAEGDARDKRYISPPGNNAVESYKKVLQLDPGNTGAISGLKKIVEVYISLSDSSSRNNDYRKAGTYLETAQNMLPANRIFDYSREQIAVKKSRLTGQIERARKKQEALQQAELQRQREAEAHRQEEQQKQATFNRLMAEGRQAVADDDKALAMEKYSDALNIFPDNLQAITAMSKAKKMQYKACKEIIGSWLWTIGTTTDVRADGTCSNSFLFVSLPCTWTCTDGKERKFEFKDQRTYIVTMSKDGRTLHSQGMTATRKANQPEEKPAEESEF